MPPGSTRLRRKLVEQLESNGSLTAPAVRRAFLAVPRERFIPEVAERDGLEKVYEDQAIVTAHDARGVPTSSSSQPSIMAPMLEKLDLRPGQRVLEIGAGTGYNAALIARIVGARGRVVSVELDPATARRARRGLKSVESAAKVVRGDGRAGWQREAPYDRIVVTASARSVSRAWHDQLADGGLVELPLVFERAARAQAVVTLRKEGDALRSEALLYGGFMPLRDEPGGPLPGPPSHITASERIGERSRSLAYLSGQALDRLSATQRGRLLALTLSEPRTRRLGVRAPFAGLALYLAIELPEHRFLGGWGRFGVIGQNGDGAAFLAGGRRTLTRIESYGAEDAERLLVELIETWRRRGRPTGEDLRVEVSFRGRGEPEVRLSWT